MKRAAVLLCVFVLLGCAVDNQSGEEQQLIFGLSGDPDTLDPHATTGTLTFQVVRSAYDTLVEPAPSGEIVPALATSWSVSPDGLEWEFELREDVLFHHGRTLSADDVVATLERLRSESFASPNAFEYAAIESVLAVDPRTVRLTLSEPYAPLLATLASGWSAILPADLIASGHDFAAEPVGTGPFQFVDWVRDSSISFDRHDEYWIEGRPLLDGVTFQIITEPAVMAQSLIAGEVDVADIVVEPELSLIREAPNVVIDESPSALVLVLAINTRREPLDDVRTRRAIASAIDRQAVLDQAYAGGVTVDTFMDATNPWYPEIDSPVVYDPAFSAQVASELSIEDELVISLPQNFQPHVRAGEMYHDMLRRAGFPVATRLVDWSTWISDIYRDAQFDMTVIGHTGKLDPHGRLAQFGTAETYVGWEDETTADAIERARVETDPQRRRELYQTALVRMAEGLPFVYLGSPYRYIGLNGELEGFRVDSRLDTADLRDVEFR